MKESIRVKLDDVSARFEELSALLADPDVIGDQNRFRKISKEYAQLEPVVKAFGEYQQTQKARTDAEAMLEDSDTEVRELAEEEIRGADQRLEQLEDELQRRLLPSDPNDDKSIFLEIRAGTGGHEAALFAGDLFRMYSRYAENQGWRVEVLQESLGEHGGYKEIIARVAGKGVYARFKFESGTHRVQRVPETESQGRIHTSACTVAVLPEQEPTEVEEINTSDLKVDTFRSSGAGGQHVNTTDSAVRITHLPTGIVVECQDERSQHKNRARAMAFLQAKLEDMERQKQEQERSETRRLQVGTGDRSQRIRTYNFPQGRVTDHRINLTLYQLDQVIEGQLDQVIDPLIQEHQADQLAEMAQAAG